MSDDRTKPSAIAQLPGAGILIPCPADEFGQFISSLLGKAQISRGRILGSFSIGLPEIQNFHFLVDQRISKQNRGQLVQFTISIKFDDGTSVELPSFEDLNQYSEVRPVISTSVLLTWVYLVTFQNSKFPERQQIQVEVDAAPEGFVLHDEFLFPFDQIDSQPSFIGFEIAYTGRTWGSDIENLLRDHIKSILMAGPSQVRSFIKKWRKYIRRIFFILTYAVLATILYWLSRGMIHGIRDKYDAISTAHDLTSIEKLLSTVTYISHDITDVVVPGFVLVMLFSLICAGALAGWITNKVAERSIFELPSFVLLTRRSIESQKIRMRRYEKNWKTFAASFIVAVVASISADVATLLLLK